MDVQIFYSWQSDTNEKYNNRLIQKALETAIKRLGKEKKDFHFKPMLDRVGKPKRAGQPNVISEINKKIRSCDIFVADITYITKYQPATKGKAKPRIKGAINSNVAIELGQAKSLLGDKRILKIMNAAYGSPSTGVELPFDIEQDSHPIQYTATNEGDAKVALEGLSETLYLAIDGIILEHEILQKERFKPLLTFKRWGELVTRTVNFVSNEQLNEKISVLRSQADKEKSITRISGLSGIGKSRLTYEALSSNFSNSTFTSLAVLYYDASQRENSISERISELTAEGESFVFVVDNALPELHDRLSRIIQRDSSTSSLITIAPELEESELLGGRTMQIRIEPELGKQIAIAILQERFNSADYFTLQQAISTVGGLPSLAVHLTQQPELDVYALTQVTSTNWVNAVLGQQAKDGNHRAILRALAVFGTVGFENELVQQAKLLAENDFIMPLDGLAENQRWTRCQKIVKSYIKKGVIGKKGRYIMIQPQHLALELAREWWQEQGNDITSILESVKATPLATAMFEQLRQLSRVPLAQQLVVSLCSREGPLGQSDIILTEEGARFIQSLADLNPDAVTNCLTRELLPLSVDRLREAVDSRRSLVWALEKLCRYESTFEKAARLLQHLAVAENERITNNATGQFRQLYQFKLSGTAANYTQRVNVLEYGVQRNDLLFDRVVITACATALNPVGITRMVVDSEQLQPWQEFEPKIYEEIWAYWEGVVEILKGYAVNTSHSLQAEAAEILVQSLSRLVPFGGVHVLISSIEMLVNNSLVPSKQVRNAVKFVLHQNNGFIAPADLQRLKQLVNETEPATFEEKLDCYVFDFASSSEFQDLGEQALQQRAELLAPEFVERRDLWKNTAFISYGKNPFYTHAFFKAVAVLIATSEEDTNQLLGYLLDGLRNNSDDTYNVTNSLTGFLNGSDMAITEKTLREVMIDTKLRHLLFYLVAGTTCDQTILNELLELVEREELPINGFDQLRHGRILSDLSVDDFEQIIHRIAAVSMDGKWVALSLLWNRNNEDEQTHWWPLIQQLVLVHGLWGVDVDDSLEYRGLYALSRILKETTDPAVVEACTRQIVHYVDQPELFRMRGDAYMPLKTLLEKHFKIAWPLIADTLSTEEVSGLYAQLGSSTESRPTDGVQFERQGLLFEFGDYDQIINWCHKQQVNVRRRLANILPVFHPDQPDTWHPFTCRFIDEFGQDESLLREIQARMNTWGANGSVEDMYKSHLALFNQLTNHPKPAVQVWALQRVDRIPLMAKGERVFMEELYLNR